MKLKYIIDPDFDDLHYINTNNILHYCFVPYNLPHGWFTPKRHFGIFFLNLLNNYLDIENNPSGITIKT